MKNFVFMCWAEGIAWFACRCGVSWISKRELPDHVCETEKRC